MSDEDTVRTVRFGFVVEDFMRTEVCQYLINRATDDRIEAQLGLEEVPPTDTAVIMKLQLKAQIGKRFEQWLLDAIMAGKQAEAIINSEEL